MAEQASAVSATSRDEGGTHRTFPPALGHRPEIDGLRSLAILPILLLHCGVSALAGGYIGVDIFFVISGYLITAIVMREVVAGSFSLVDFYRRRIVRILPALVVMIAVVLAAGCVLLFPVELRKLGQSAAATAAFGSNIYFYLTIDYFSSDTNPLVHTWSLAVEEQFYLLYPLLLIALQRAQRRSIIGLFVVLSVISFAIGGYLAFRDPSAAFYLLPSRIWELLLGGLVALGAYPQIRRAWMREVICWGALAVILIAIVILRPSSHFPVPLAIPPALGAALLIAYAPETRAAALLSLKPLRWIGLISYSLYLWHRPIIAFYLLHHGFDLRLADITILLVLCFGAAILSYVLVERPALRRWRAGRGWAPHAAALAALALTAGAGLLIAAWAPAIRTFPPEVARVASFIGHDRTPEGRAQYGTGRCFALPYTGPNDPECLLPAPDRPNVMLLGDSFGAQLSGSLRREIGPARLLQATSAGCRPLLEMPGLESCRRLVLHVLHDTDFSKVTQVVLAARWTAADVDEVGRVVRHLKARGVDRVVVVGPAVEYDAEVASTLARAMLAGDVSRLASLRRAEPAEIERRMRPVAEAAGAAYVSHFALECPDGACRFFAPDGSPIHTDYSHLSPAGADIVARAIAARLHATTR